MPIYQTTGIILGRTNFGEADRILRILTRDHGKISALAKGVRKLHSRAGGHLEPLGEVVLSLATGRSLDVITSARLSWYPHELTAHYDRLSLALAMATALDRAVEPDAAQPPLYALLAEGLRAADAATDTALPELWFKLRLLTLLGYQPELGKCVVCGRDDEHTDYRLNARLGGLVCLSDAEAADPELGHRAIKLWRLLCNYPYSIAAAVAEAPAIARSTLNQGSMFYEYHLGNTFKYAKN
jgi:DNA repair protein RecO (recombination protein O)